MSIPPKPPGSPSFQPKHRPLPPKQHPNSVLNKPPCKNCGDGVTVQRGNQFGGRPDEQIAVPKRRQLVSGIGDIPMGPEGLQYTSQDAPAQILQHELEETFKQEVGVNPVVGTELRSEMMTDAPPWAAGLFNEVRSLQVQVAAFKTLLMMPAKPLITEALFNQAVQMVEESLAEQMNAMTLQLGRSFQVAPRPDGKPNSNDPRVAPRTDEPVTQ